VFSTLRLRIRARVTRAVARAKRLLRETFRPLPLVAGALEDLTRSRGELIAENAMLRQQLIVASRKVKRPAFRAHERGLLVVLSNHVRGWRDALLLIKPGTILRWHREGFSPFLTMEVPQAKACRAEDLRRRDCSDPPNGPRELPLESRTYPRRAPEAGHHRGQAHPPALPTCCAGPDPMMAGVVGHVVARICVALAALPLHWGGVASVQAGSGSWRGAPPEACWHEEAGLGPGEHALRST
jgi:hypothetical protein